ncbi:hypothetical protein PROVRUST_05858 [Providencia rustigianii DSM 4541]|uniref:Uncharacterized protein n=1 Tax=Providencia rustigianii DSM 4541 TaxID=500637 RepID=D1P140_9GAMM|nr:hypothetical protein PROVRUST_05858 [Providencia rustigianii DSM 4541]
MNIQIINVIYWAFTGMPYSKNKYLLAIKLIKYCLLFCFLYN